MAAAALSNWIGGFALALIGAAFLLGEFRGRMAALGLSSPAGPMPSRRHSSRPPLSPPYRPMRHWLPREASKPIPYSTPRSPRARWLSPGPWRRRQVDRPIRVAALFFYFTASISLLAMWFKLNVIPQPERYHLEMDLAFWLLAGLIAAKVRAGPSAHPDRHCSGDLPLCRDPPAPPRARA